jgi:hypothetical protein
VREERTFRRRFAAARPRVSSSRETLGPGLGGRPRRSTGETLALVRERSRPCFVALPRRRSFRGENWRSLEPLLDLGGPPAPSPFSAFASATPQDPDFIVVTEVIVDRDSTPAERRHPPRATWAADDGAGDPMAIERSLFDRARALLAPRGDMGRGAERRHCGSRPGAAVGRSRRTQHACA